MMKRQWATLGPRSEKKNFEKGKIINSWVGQWMAREISLFVHGMEDQTAEAAATREVS